MPTLVLCSHGASLAIVVTAAARFRFLEGGEAGIFILFIYLSIYLFLPIVLSHCLKIYIGSTCYQEIEVEFFMYERFLS